MSEMVCKKIRLDLDPDIEIIEINNKNSIECPLCFKMVSESLESHFSLNHREFECLFCGKSLNSSEDLNEHINKIHLDDSPIQQQTKEKYTCPICGIEMKEESSLSIHVETHFQTDSGSSSVNSHTEKNVNKNEDKESKKITSCLNSQIENSLDSQIFERNLKQSQLYKWHKESELKEITTKSTKFDDDFAIDYNSENDMNQYSAEQEHEWLKSNFKYNHNEKQKFYDDARAPVQKLRTELDELNTLITYVEPQSVEEKSFVNKQIKDLGQNLKIAIQNASKDIFERVNSKEKNFIQIDGKTIFSVDLHGLHSKEARSIVDEHVLPVLDALGQIMIITGRGIHSKKRGKSILKENVKKYFVELKIRVQDITGNDGAFFIFKNGA